MIDQYTQHLRRKRRAEGTIRIRLFYLTKFARWFRADLTAATHDDFEAYIGSGHRWSQNTQQVVTATLKAFYGWAHREGILTENPTRDLPAVTVHRRRQRIASEAAIRTAILCDDISDRAMILLGAECGLRVNEIATLHQSNRDGDWLHIIGKGNKQRTLKVEPELAEILDQIEATRMRHGHYFPGKSGIHPIHPSTAWRHITRVLNSNPHSLRRRAGTIVYRNSGHDIRLAQTFLGHAASTTTELYLEVRKDDLALAGSLTRVAA
jgi:integrase